MFKTIQDEKFTCKIYNPRTLRCSSFPTDKPLKNNNRLPTRQLHSRAVKKKKKNRATSQREIALKTPKFRVSRLVVSYKTTPAVNICISRKVSFSPPRLKESRERARFPGWNRAKETRIFCRRG